MVDGDRICSVEDCNAKLYCGGYCTKHYQRWLKYRDPLKTLKGTPEKVDEFGNAICTADNCNRRILAGSLCSMHYQRKLRHGSIEPTRASYGDPLKFIHEIPQTDECVNWPYGLDGHGYGVVCYERDAEKAHRVAYKIHVGPLETSQCILHQCDNSKCVNPRHFKIGTKADNSNEMKARDRQARGSQVRSKLTEEDAKEILRLKGVVTQKELRIRYGVSNVTISMIHRRKIWKHISLE